MLIVTNLRWMMVAKKLLNKLGLKTPKSKCWKVLQEMCTVHLENLLGLESSHLDLFSFGFQSPEDLKLFVGFFSVFYGLQLNLTSKHPSWNFPHKTLYRIYVIKLDFGQNIVKL